MQSKLANLARQCAWLMGTLYSLGANAQFSVVKLEGQFIIETTNQSLLTFDQSANHVRTYDLNGKLLADKQVTGPLWLTSTPTRALGNMWLSGSMLFDNDFNLSQSLYQTAAGTNKTCADGSELKLAEDMYSYDLNVRNNKYVLTSKQGLTFFDRDWNCLKRVKIQAWKPGGNGSFRASGRAPAQLNGSNDVLYMVDDYVHYIFDAEGNFAFVGQLGPQGLPAADLNRPLRYGMEISTPRRMADGSVLMTRSAEEFLVVQSMTRTGQLRQPVTIHGPFINTSYNLKIHEEEDRSLTLTYSEWVLRFDASGNYLGSRKFSSPVVAASSNNAGQLLVKLMTEGSGAGSFYEPFVWLDNTLTPIKSFAFNTLFSASNLMGWGSGYLIGSYSEVIGSNNQHYPAVINAQQESYVQLGVRIPEACSGSFCQVQSLSLEHVFLPNGRKTHLFKSYPDVVQRDSEGLLYLAVY